MNVNTVLESAIRPALHSAWLLLALIVLPLAASAKGLPEWVQSPPQDTDNLLFGIGQGASIPNATQSALESVAGKLMTEVESNLTIDTQVEDNIAKESVASQIRSQVAKTNLANYSVEATERDGKDFFVLVKVDQNAVWKANQDALKENLAEIDAYFGKLDKRSTLDVTEEQGAIEDKIKQARSKALISRSLNPNYDHTAISEKLRSYEAKLQDKVDNKAIYIVASPDLTPLAQRLANQLTNEGFTVSLTKPITNTPEIHLDGKFDQYDQFNQKHVTARTVIRVMDEFNKAVSTTEVVLTGASMLSHDSAKTIAINRYMQEVEIQGAAASLGLADK